MLDSIDWKTNLSYIVATFLFFFLFQAFFAFLSGGTSLLALNFDAFKFGEAALFAIIPTAAVAIFSFGFDFVKVGVNKAIDSFSSDKIQINERKHQIINKSPPINLENQKFNNNKIDPMIQNYIQHNLNQKQFQNQPKKQNESKLDKLPLNSFNKK